MSKRWDTVVIGAGPAGLTTARGLASAGLSCLCLERLGPGGMLMNLGPLHDHAEPTTGPDLGSALLDAATEAGVELGFGEVRALRAGDPWQVETDESTHVARTVVLATGSTPGTLGIADEDAYEGRGLSRCAACDGPLYRGQAVVLAGSDRWAMQEALDLLAFTEQVTLVVPPNARADAPPGVTHRTGLIVALEGEDGLDAVVIAQDGGRERLPTRAVFVLTGRRPALDFAPGGMACDPDGRVLVGADLRTSLPAVYAVGDVRSGASEQVQTAIADGERAAQAIVNLLAGGGLRKEDA